MMRRFIIIAIVLQISHAVNKFKSNSKLDVYEKAAVAANAYECSKIGTNILKKNGSAVDAAISVLLCEGIASPISMGIGGGFLMTIYDAPSNSTIFLDARAAAPSLAHQTMFQDNPNSSIYGGLAIAVPGEVMGYWEAHQKYGRLPWKDLFEPAIELANTGSVINKHLEYYLNNIEEFIRNNTGLAEIFINPKTNKLYAAGDRIKRTKLAKTLRVLADHENASDLFYKGFIGRELAKEIQAIGGIITAEDFSSYRVYWREPIEAKIGNMTMYTAPPPGSGAILVFMMNVLEGLLPVEDERIMWQRIIETSKWAFAKRNELCDPSFADLNNLLEKLTSKDYAKSIRQYIKDDETYNDPKYYGAVTSNIEPHGTAHVSILAPDGSAVSATSTLNHALGAKIESMSTGIVFNSEMDVFNSPTDINEYGLPPSPNNYIEPYKRPLSAMTPTIVLDQNRKVKLVIGAAGDSRIVTTVASIMILHFLYNYNIKEAIDAYRLHHQLFPMSILSERNFPSDILDYLGKIGHKANTFSGIYSTSTSIAVETDRITANNDYRRDGRTSGF